ncbi:MAG TPA: glycosyltransferase family 4 protein [Cyclobacteriaceae bacterium]|nr:glycosyltransferase family 4 protein [Cyclobacteriaceae bacterium]HNU41171.1 glycosyltransferase family 4 protein [Cyclobacteriaceae bacterium]
MFTRSYLNVVPSRFLEFHLKKASYAVKYIPNFVELKKYPFKQREFIQPRILWVRAFHKIYNPVMAVNVMAQLNDGRAQLCMVGADTDGTRSLVENRIQELNLSSQITLTGRLMKEEWIKLSQEYDIFINTTTIDNMPVSVIEAMALGLPVVSTAVGGVPYLIENNKTGILVESNNVEAMTNAIRHVLQNPDHAKSISLNARKEVEDFDWENVSLKWFDVLDGIMTRRTV